MIPNREQERWRVFLEEVGHRFYHGTPAFAQFQAADPSFPRIDLMIVDEGNWSKLSAEAFDSEIGEGVPLLVAAPEHLVAMKPKACQSARRREGATDWSDIVELVKRRGLDLSSGSSLRQIVLHYGNEEILTRLLEDVDRTKEA